MTTTPRMSIEETSLNYGFNSAIVVPSTGSSTVNGSQMANLLRHGAAAGPIYAEQAPRRIYVNYRCRERANSKSEDAAAKSCFLYGQPCSGITEPSEYVPGITLPLASIPPVNAVEQRLQGAPARRPMEDTEGTRNGGELEVGASLKFVCKPFVCQYAEPLPKLSNLHRLICR